ncbi:hypothetical protein N5E99_07940 [Pseudomonas chengduensis]|nr:hypothetical protein [Pseudomonas chengduensis]MDH1535680.1 hypothetical protein [Pseudomonas chengduensis]
MSMEKSGKGKALLVWEFIKSPGVMAVLSIMSLAIGLYFGFIYERKGEVSILVSPPAKVLDIHEAVGGLEVSYAGQNLKDSGKTLWAVVVYFTNTGNSGINKIEFDDQDLLGIGVVNGEIVDRPEIDGSVDYLKRNLKIDYSKESIRLHPFIMEPGDTVTLNFLVLGVESAKPEFKVLGKVSGVSEPVITRLDDDKGFSTWRSVTYAEKWWVQLLRMPVYFGFMILFLVGAMLFFALFIIPIDAFSDSRKKKKLREQVDSYKMGEVLTRESRLLINMHLKSPNFALSQVYGGICSLEDRAKLRDKISSVLSAEDLKNVCFRCYPISKSAVQRMKDDLGFNPEEDVDLEEIVKWKSEIKQLADFLNVDLSDKVHSPEVLISPEFEERMSPRAIAVINQEIDRMNDVG